ncbi:MAG TPA: nitroreductase family protein [Clostridiales bacterium]|nr:nitroreductase family protein [Clostridiales bacterium]
MSAYDIILRRRTIRKFKQDKIERELLVKLVNAARHAPSGANMQPAKYLIIDDSNTVKKIFEHLKWAGYIAPHGDPKEGERPVAYIIVLADTRIRKSGYELDLGAAIQNILITAEEENIGTCWIGSVNREEVRQILDIPDELLINSVIALGYKAESSVAEEENGSIKYYKDNKGILHVPKRKLKDIMEVSR